MSNTSNIDMDRVYKEFVEFQTHFVTCARGLQQAMNAAALSLRLLEAELRQHRNGRKPPSGPGPEDPIAKMGPEELTAARELLAKKQPPHKPNVKQAPVRKHGR